MTEPSRGPPSAPEWMRTHCPTARGRVMSSTSPANRLLSGCWAAMPTITPVSAPPTRSCFGAEFETILADAGLTLLRPARQGEPERAGARFFKPLRQTIESIFDTYKGQLNLEGHGGKTPTGVLVRVLQRILALTTAIWHNDHTGQPIKRSLLAYDH